MTKRLLELNITCTDIQECWDEIAAAVDAISPFETGGKRTSHLSINHAQGAHQIWVIQYSTAGQHEQEGTNVEDFNPANASKYFKTEDVYDPEKTVIEIDKEVARLEQQKKAAQKANDGPAFKAADVKLRHPGRIFKEQRQTKSVGFFKEIQLTPASDIAKATQKPDEATLESAIRTKLQGNPNVVIT